VNFWDWIRVLNFLLTFAGFCIIVYKGVLKLTLEPETFSWERAMNGFWSLGTLIATGAAFYTHRPGSWTVFIFTVIPVVQLWVITKFKVKEETGYAK
jgi:hypothetical protein